MCGCSSSRAKSSRTAAYTNATKPGSIKSYDEPRVTLIDWHSHHTPPELIERFEQITGKAPRPDPYDSAGFDERLAALDSVGIDLQLVSQGASVNADRLPAEHMMP